LSVDEQQRISDISDQRSGGEEKKDSNTGGTEIGTQRAQR
jgi:hypothetical protein